MAETFTLIVHYNGREYQLNGELRVFVYTHKIAMQVEGTEVLFEPDEERNYRAVIPDQPGSKTELDRGLIAAIANELEETFK